MGRTKSVPRPAKRVRHWPYFEFFLPHIDAPFFRHSEFIEVLCNNTGLISLLPLSSRQEWARARAAMCNALPNGSATPRRLSTAFLQYERLELEQYRIDARRFMRNKPLENAVDPANGDALPNVWWKRRMCPPPRCLQRGEPVRIYRKNGTVEHGHFEALSGNDSMAVIIDGRPELVSDLHVQVMETESNDNLDHPESVRVMQCAQSALVVSPKRRPNGDLECVIDVRALAQSIRAVERKKVLVHELRNLNDICEQGIADPEQMAVRYEAVRVQLDDVNEQLASLFPKLAQELRSGDEASGHMETTTTSESEELIPNLAMVEDANLSKLEWDTNDQATAVDTAALVNALVKEGLGKVSENGFRNMDESKRRQMLETVSACLGILLSARTTGSGQIITEMINQTPLRFQRNREGFHEIEDAAKSFDTLTTGHR